MLKGPLTFNRDDVLARALDFHHAHYNCAQSVVCALAGEVGLNPDDCFKIMEGFGAGMGGMTETCGALSGAVAFIGLVNSDGSDTPGTSKGHGYVLSREVVARFRQRNSTTICGVLKGANGRPKLRTCDDCVLDACNIVMDVLSE